MNKKNLSSWGVVLAYVMWGSLTVFWNLLSKVDSLYVLAQRIVWSMVFMLVLLAVTKKLPEIKTAFATKKNTLIIIACGVLITINWGVYIYAVNNGHVLDASLGYFIEPVIVALTGLLIFKEKVSKLEIVTLVFAFAGLIYMLITTGTMPVLAIIIACSFAAYGAIKKNLKIPPFVSLFAETLVITPFAIAYIIYSEVNYNGCIGVLSKPELLLLPASGILTAFPLLLFNIGVKKMPYYLTGIIMYINPTLQFIMGTFYFNETLDINRLIAFIIIWIGVMFTISDKILYIRKTKTRVKLS